MKLVTPKLSEVRSNGWQARYSGPVYSPGLPAGDETVQNFLGLISESTIEREAHKLMGNYFMVIENTSSGDWWLFCDMSGMAPLFYTEHWASPSIRVLIHHESDLTADRGALLEFLLTGHYDRSKYPVKGVKRLKGEEILHGSSRKSPTLLSKVAPLTNIGDQGDFVQSMQDISNSFRGGKLSLDLTGGWDSRLNLATLLSDEVEIETSLAAFEDHPDPVIARRIAERVGVPFFLTVPKTKDEVTEDTVSSLITAGDGLFADIETVDRKSELMKDRIARNVTLSIDGTGGELYKDFWWLQDFPFYGTKKTNIQRLIATRAHLEKLDTVPLSLTATKEIELARNQIYLRMEAHKASTNIETYDRIYRERMYGLSGQISATTMRFTGMHTYTPLLEDSRVRFAFALPIRDRVFGTFHRRVVSEGLPQIRDIPTTQGTYAQDPLPIAIYRYGRMLGGRAVNKLWQVRTGQPLVDLKSPGDKTPYFNAITGSPLWRQAVESLVRNDIISDANAVNNLSYKPVTRLLTIATILEDLEGVDTVELPPYETIIELGNVD